MAQMGRAKRRRTAALECYNATPAQLDTAVSQCCNDTEQSGGTGDLTTGGCAEGFDDRNSCLGGLTGAAHGVELVDRQFAHFGVHVSLLLYPREGTIPFRP